MAHVLDWAEAVLGLIAAVLAFVGWQIGDDGEKTAKQRLADWYVLVGVADFSKLVQYAARSTDGFFDHLLGAELWSTRAALTWFVVAETVGVLVGVWVIQMFSGGLQSVALWFALACFAIVIPLYPVDFVLLTCSRWLFRRIKERQGIAPGLVYLGYAYAAFTVSCFIAVYAIIIVVPLLNGKLVQPLAAQALRTALLRAPEWPYVIVSQPPTLLLIVPLTLSTMLFGAVIAGALLMRQFRPVMQPFAVWLIERAGTARRGILTGLALALFILIALMVLVSKV